MLVKDVHQQKATSPMEVTPSGIVIFVNDVHSKNT